MLSRTIFRTASRAVRRTTTRPLHLKATSRLQSSMPGEQQSAHTATQRIRFWIKSLPVETYPLFVVMGGSLSFGVYSFVKQAFDDPTLRLRRSRKHH